MRANQPLMTTETSGFCQIGMSSALERRDRSDERPDLFSRAGARLSRLERWNIRFVRASFSNPLLNRLMAALQRFPGSTWVEICTRQLRTVHGLERLPPPGELDNFILVSNHRSYFDLYVISMVLIQAGLKKRMLYPVRSKFFYDHPLGWWVNGIMSFWSMYPPIFRERKKAVLNHTAMSEVIWSLANAKVGVGIHPEGTRNLGEDPYTFLPAQAGVGRVIHQSRAMVIPVFINGLINDLKKQVSSNFDKTGREVIVMFGAPIDFGGLLDEPGNAKVFRSLADMSLEAVRKLGEEERALRAEREAARVPASSS